MKAIIPFIIIAICVGVYFMYISPIMDDINVKNQKKAEYVNVLNQAKELKVQRDAISAAYNNIPASDLESLSKIIPESFNAVSLANEISSISSRYNLSVKEIKTDETTTANNNNNVTGESAPAGPYRTIVVTFKLTGQYEEFIKFLKDLQSGLHLVDVVGLSIKSTPGKKSTDVNLEYSLEVHTYSLQ